MLLPYELTASYLLSGVDKFIEKLQSYTRQQARFAKDHAKELKELGEKVANRTATEADIMSILIIVDTYAYKYHILRRDLEDVQSYGAVMAHYLRVQNIPVTVRFKGEEIEWKSVTEAVEHYYPLMKAGSWGDRIRYEKILTEMSFGRQLCTDGSKPKVEGEVGEDVGEND